jgi:hypothetical protein
MTATCNDNAFTVEGLQDVVDICTAIKQDRRPPSCLRFCFHPHDGRLREVYPVTMPNLSLEKTTITLEEVLRTQLVDGNRRRPTRESGWRYQ